MIDVKKIAQLARLQISEAENKMYKVQMDEIFKFFEEISSVETKGIEPLVTPSEIEQVFRADKKEVFETAEEAVRNAPESMGNLFKVPPVI